MLEDALRFSFEKLTKDQLIDLAIMLVEEGLHSAGRKPKITYTPHCYGLKKPDINEIMFDTRIEAEMTLDKIMDMEKDYGFVSIADIYEVCGYESSFAENQVGWNNLSKTRIDHRKDGYKLVLPSLAKPYLKG